jgi:predicted permease
MRERELSVRCALGASANRIAAQFSAEALLLALTGALLGTLIGIAALRIFDSAGAQLLPRWSTVHVDGRVAAYTIVLVGITTLLTGFLPAMRSTRGLLASLRSAGRSGDSSAQRRLREALVCVEVALAVVVAFSAGLLVQSFVRLTHVNTGYNASGTYFVSFALPDGQTGPQELELAQRVQREVSAIPGVADTALAGPMPYTYEHLSRLSIPGRPDTAERVSDSEVSPEFFHMLRIPILRGRGFAQMDTAHSQPVVIVDAAFAQHYFGTLDVVGRTIMPWRTGEPGAGPKPAVVPRRIVGVVGGVRRSLASTIVPTVYLPISQVTIPNHLLVRMSATHAGIASAIDAAFARADSRFAQPHIARYEELVAADIVTSTAATQLFCALAVIALLVALAGIYAVNAESVAQRTHEFGIRRAVGARAREIVREVLSGAGRQSVVGLLAGVALAAAATRLLTGLLFDTSPLDMTVIAIIVACVTICSASATLLPALRAARVEPAAALRYE